MEEYADELMRSDASLFPSYTNLTIPYRVKCRNRYKRTAVAYKNQFLHEHELLELTQPRALHGIRFHREFCEPRMAPLKPEDFIRIPPRLKRRLEYILENPVY